MSKRRTYGLPGGRHTPSHVAEPPSTETGALKSGSMSSSSRFCAAPLDCLGTMLGSTHALGARMRSVYGCTLLQTLDWECACTKANTCSARTHALLV
jgi:hypothetical protein